MAGSGSNTKQLIKGPWCKDEDEILKEFVRRNGEGNWHRVSKETALRRCGKSCRLRWINQLRPHIVKGPFTKEEEDAIVELQAKYGNKWTQIALQLNGRSESQIKNFWRAREKRLNKIGVQPIVSSLPMLEGPTTESLAPFGSMFKSNTSISQQFPNQLLHYNFRNLLEPKFTLGHVFKKPKVDQSLYESFPLLTSHSMPCASSRVENACFYEEVGPEAYDGLLESVVMQSNKYHTYNPSINSDVNCSEHSVITGKGKEKVVAM